MCCLLEVFNFWRSKDCYHGVFGGCGGGGVIVCALSVLAFIVISVLFHIVAAQQTEHHTSIYLVHVLHFYIYI